MKNNNFKTILLSLIVMALWGSLFPMVKIGYNAFNINSSSIPDILMFASVRFLISGIIVCAFSLIRREKISSPKIKSILNIFIVGFFSIVLHYAFTYIGLSVTDSSKTALIKQIGSLIYVCFAFLFFKEEKFSILKILGAFVGFLGIIAINYSGSGVSFSTGDFIIILASVSTVISSILVKKTANGTSAFWITGISQLLGGIILFIAALIMGGTFLQFSLKAVLVFSYICIASISAYTLWYYNLKTSYLSSMFIIKFSEPLFACVFGAILLGEDIFKIQYLLAFILISLGIIFGNKKVVNNESNN